MLIFRWLIEVVPIALMLKILIQNHFCEYYVIIVQRLLNTGGNL